ncbi:MAG: maleylpyruvate isomerase N-terminal domain-containing protein [Labedaea sp.]
MDYSRWVDELSVQAGAMRAAVVGAGPDAPAPTCPDWTVRDLVRHLAKVHQWAGRSLVTHPDGPAPAPDEPPAAWEELLAWWDAQRDILVERLRERGPDDPAWTFPPAPGAAGFWARRQAHETAIHRLDAEHAATGSALADAVPTLVFDPELAADGIDEALTLMVPLRASRQPITVGGTVLFHAADAGRAWLLRLRPGELPEVGPVGHPAIDADASVVGTADAVYRAMWRRPSHAVRGGDPVLIDALRVP